MENNTSYSALSLRTKLVLSYLAVILGTVLVLSFAVSWAVQNYYFNLQKHRLQATAYEVERDIEHGIIFSHGHHFTANLYEAGTLFALMIPGENMPICQQAFIGADNCNNPILTKALHQALQGKSTDFSEIQLIAPEGGNISSIYTSRPLQVNDHIIGAMFLAEPQISPKFSFLQQIHQINEAILIAGFVVAGIALFTSVLLVRRLTQPLEDLTVAAEQMKLGQYTQRVSLPKKLDELGQLGLTFNEMADTIEADITELRRQDQVRRDLIANIAHDLATPLTAIQGFSEALADNVISDSDERQETAQRIGREVQRLRRLVADIQQMTSLEAGHTKLDLAPLDIHAQVDETIAVIAPECEQQGIHMHNDIKPSIPQVIADSDRITQVLLNLVDNARRHTPDGGTIRVGATLQDHYLYIWVNDTGIGIDPADLPHIFQRFYRADRSRTTSTGGSGLGLSIVKAIITAHGGTIWAESALGQGTRITFTLPIVMQTQTTTSTHSEREY
ncbi:MAG TPA: HAMP domain-containing sensor histidine kinase [Ktedonobacteraceae bacterium]|nr:HAMP domain-containing sensor histidine kinase [Ktedonobacteraceae bacterium]